MHDDTEKGPYTTNPANQRRRSTKMLKINEIEDFESRAEKIKEDKRKEIEVKPNITYGNIVLPRKFKLRIEFIEETSTIPND